MVKMLDEVFGIYDSEGNFITECDSYDDAHDLALPEEGEYVMFTTLGGVGDGMSEPCMCEQCLPR
jgi:hypothetical protein